MERRAFLKATMATSCVLGAAGSAQAAEAAGQAGGQGGSGREYYELRVYTLKSPEQQALVETYLRTAAIPAINKLGVETVGVFTELKPEIPKVYVLIVYPSLREFTTLSRRFMQDEELQKAGAAYLNTPKDAPAFEQLESELMVAFQKMPKLAKPAKKERMFELRHYISHNETKAMKKIEMFNSAEIEIFKKVGLTSVFYGQVLIGNNMPHLTYMTTFDNMEDHDKDWKAFQDSPEWNELKAKPEYADTVARSVKVLLKPTDYSQI